MVSKSQSHVLYSLNLPSQSLVISFGIHRKSETDSVYTRGLPFADEGALMGSRSEHKSFAQIGLATDSHHSIRRESPAHAGHRL